MPPRRKQLDYQKQRRGFSEYHHSLRHGKWRRNKRRPAQQSERQAERIALATRASFELRDPGFDAGVIVRPRIGKWGAATLGEWVTRQTRRRR